MSGIREDHSLWSISRNMNCAWNLIAELTAIFLLFSISFWHLLLNSKFWKKYFLPWKKFCTRILFLLKNSINLVFNQKICGQILLIIQKFPHVTKMAPKSVRKISRFIQKIISLESLKFYSNTWKVANGTNIRVDLNLERDSSHVFGNLQLRPSWGLFISNASTG